MDDGIAALTGASSWIDAVHLCSEIERIEAEERERIARLPRKWLRARPSAG